MLAVHLLHKLLHIAVVNTLSAGLPKGSLSHFVIRFELLNNYPWEGELMLIYTRYQSVCVDIKRWILAHMCQVAGDTDSGAVAAAQISADILPHFNEAVKLYTGIYAQTM